MFQQQMTLRIDDEAQSKTMKEIKHKKDVWFKELQSRIRSEVSESQAKIDLASEKGASSWLTSLPLALFKTNRKTAVQHPPHSANGCKRIQRKGDERG